MIKNYSYYNYLWGVGGKITGSVDKYEVLVYMTIIMNDMTAVNGTFIYISRSEAGEGNGENDHVEVLR